MNETTTMLLKELAEARAAEARAKKDLAERKADPLLIQAERSLSMAKGATEALTQIVREHWEEVWRAGGPKKEGPLGIREVDTYVLSDEQAALEWCQKNNRDYVKESLDVDGLRAYILFKQAENRGEGLPMLICKHTIQATISADLSAFEAKYTNVDYKAS